MCFNATASFMAAAVLVPVGVYTIHHVMHAGDRRYLWLAAFPLLFGVQQGIEGVLWLQLGAAAGDFSGGAAVAVALAFLFFAYLLWPGLVPIAAWRIEASPLRRRFFAVAAVLGAALGVSLYLPLLLDPGWLDVGVVRGSILYEPRLIYDSYVDRQVIRGVYALIVALPLLAASDAMVRGFGALILASVLLSALVFGYAFVSVWCFFAALLSAYLAVALHAHRPLHPDRWPRYAGRFGPPRSHA